MSDYTLSNIGTIGCFALLVVGALRRGRYAELLVPIVFCMLIVDVWAVAPLDFKNRGWSTNWLWALALTPYVQLVRWLVQFMRTLSTQTDSR